MSLTIETVVEQDYLLVRCSGAYQSVQDIKDLFQRAVDAARQYRKAQVLVDVYGVTGQISFVDRYAGALFLTELLKVQAWNQIRRFAMAGQPPVIDPSRIGETVAANRGVNARVFLDLEEAVAWLGERGAPGPGQRP